MRWVILFAAVAQERSFTRAAARLNLAQPWLSAQVRKLEAELGVTLFTRERNRIELTEEGARLLPAAIQIADAAQRFRDLARELSSDRGAAVRIGSHVAALGARQLAQLNDAFAARYPNFAFEVQSDATDLLLDAVRGGALDIAFVMQPYDAEGLEAIPLRREPAYLLAPRIEPWASARRATVGLMAGQAVGVIPRERHPAFYDEALAPLAAQGVLLRPVPEPDGRAMAALVRGEDLPVIMIEAEAQAFAKDPRLVALPLEPPLVLRHDLVRPRNALAGRAADRYWRLAQAQTT